MGDARPDKLVLLVEGYGDVEAVPLLVKKLLNERKAWDCLSLDHKPIRIGGIDRLTGKHGAQWLKKLGVAALRPRTAAVLAILDGDADSVEGTAFCVATVAHALAHRARAARAGEKFSVACVFARREFESWLIAGIDSIAGKSLPDGRAGIRAGTTSAGMDTEEAPRDAKKWLSQHMLNGYKPTQDQALLTQIVEVTSIRARNLRSFRRLEHALDILIDSVRTGCHGVSPVSST